MRNIKGYWEEPRPDSSKEEPLLNPQAEAKRLNSIEERKEELARNLESIKRIDNIIKDSLAKEAK